jgi:hypothetical protein
MTTAWEPYRESLRTTLARTVAIALVAGAVLNWSMHAGVRRLPMSILLMFWPSFGGHWVELWFLNWLRPRLPDSRGVQIVARLIVWFIGGIVLGLGMCVTALLLAGFRPAHWPPWWILGFAFIGVELIAQLALQLRGRPSFYNGRG